MPKPRNAVTRRPGPADALSVRDGRLWVEDRPASDLVEEFGSPLFVFSEAQLRGNLRRFRNAFGVEWPEGPVDVLPAFKANTLLELRRILSEEGGGADIYSPEELAGVLSTGVDRDRVSVNGGGKSREHLRTCVAAGVRITVEDVDEIDLIQEVAAELGEVARVRLRCKPAVPNLWRRTDFSQLSVPIDLGVQVYKSGIPREYLAEMGRRVFAMSNVELVGLHFHVGRHHPSLWFWEGLMTRYAQLVGELSRAWDGWRPAELDIGGGMPSPRDPHNEEMALSDSRLTAAGLPAHGRRAPAGGAHLPRADGPPGARADRPQGAPGAAHDRGVRRDDHLHAAPRADPRGDRSRGHAAAGGARAKPRRRQLHRPDPRVKKVKRQTEPIPMRGCCSATRRTSSSPAACSSTTGTRSWSPTTSTGS